MRAAPCCDPQVFDKPMVAAWGVLSTCVRQLVLGDTGRLQGSMENVT
jgi:hypothetical protein